MFQRTRAHRRRFGTRSHQTLRSLDHRWCARRSTPCPTTCAVIAGVTVAVPRSSTWTPVPITFAPNLHWRDVEFGSRVARRPRPAGRRSASTTTPTSACSPEYRVGKYAGTRNLIYITRPDRRRRRHHRGRAPACGAPRASPARSGTCTWPRTARCAGVGGRGAGRRSWGCDRCSAMPCPTCWRCSTPTRLVGPEEKVALRRAPGRRRATTTVLARAGAPRALARATGWATLVNVFNPEVVVLRRLLPRDRPVDAGRGRAPHERAVHRAQRRRRASWRSRRSGSPRRRSGAAIHAAERVFEDPGGVGTVA